MKFFSIFFLLLFSYNALSAERSYLFTRTEKMAGDINSLEGIVTFSIDGKSEIVSVDLQGNKSFNFWDDIKFKTEAATQYGFEIHDVRRKNEPAGMMSIFAHHIEISDFKPGYKTRNIETERRHPYFKDYSWNFFLTYKKNESIKINGKKYDAGYIYVKGDRPTGGGHCRPGQPGTVKIHSWYDLEDSTLLKQVFEKYLCKPYDYNLLERDTFIKNN